MRQQWQRGLAVVVAAVLLGGCAGDEKPANSTVGGAASTPAQATVAAAASATISRTAAATGTPGASTSMDYHRFEKYVPNDKDLPPGVIFQQTIDLSNEAAANNTEELKEFVAQGRLGGVQALFRVENRNVSVGISYFRAADAAKTTLLQSGDPAATGQSGRFVVEGVGDAYVARKLQLGSGTAVARVNNIAFTRERFFVAIADIGSGEEFPTDVVVRLSQQIDALLRKDPNP